MILGIPDFWFWIAVAGVALAIEIGTILLVSIWFVLGAGAAAVAALLGATHPVQLMVMLGVSALALALSFAFRKRLGIGSRGHVPTNADRLIGETGVVLEAIDGVRGRGRIRVGSEVWGAKSDAVIPEGTAVCVKAIEGVKLVVEERKEL